MEKNDEPFKIYIMIKHSLFKNAFLLTIFLCISSMSAQNRITTDESYFELEKGLAEVIGEFKTIEQFEKNFLKYKTELETYIQNEMRKCAGKQVIRADGMSGEMDPDPQAYTFTFEKISHPYGPMVLEYSNIYLPVLTEYRYSETQMSTHKDSKVKFVTFYPIRSNPIYNADKPETDLNTRTMSVYLDFSYGVKGNMGKAERNTLFTIPYFKDDQDIGDIRIIVKIMSFGTYNAIYNLFKIHYAEEKARKK